MTVLLAIALAACTEGRAEQGTTITFSGSAVGAEGQVLATQVARFERLNPGIHVRVQRTPDDATQRHQLYVQWLNAHVGDPDVLQLDVIWTAEFAAAGWIRPLTPWHPDVHDFFTGAVNADMWAGELYAMPWFLDAGMLYWRTDLFPHAPATMAEMQSALERLRRQAGAPPNGLVLQASRYEGLVTGFVEFLGGFGGRIMDDSGRVVVDQPQGIQALRFMRALVDGGLIPRDALGWHEEESRLDFQNGRAALLRNWPYAYALLNGKDSRVAGKFAVVPMPAAPGGSPSAALGGQQIAINAFSEHPDLAYRLLAYLTAPEQMVERVRIAGNLPPNRALYDKPELRANLPIPADQIRQVLEHATPRPVTPIYSQLSELLQIQLHRALTGQATPDDALHEAARQMSALVERTHVRELVARSVAR
jgi:multiple sugar transport system substrate-binding protein